MEAVNPFPDPPLALKETPLLAGVQFNPGVPELHATLSVTGAPSLSCVPRRRGAGGLRD